MKNPTSLHYAFPAFTGLLGKAPLARDGEHPHDRGDFALDAMARSGDYFVTLASRLDALARTVEGYEERLQIEDIVSDLIYMQDNYQLTKKER
jgi:hypothetical protein